MNEILKKIEDTLDARFSSDSGRYSWNSDEDEEGNSFEIDLVLHRYRRAD